MPGSGLAAEDILFTTPGMKVRKRGKERKGERKREGKKERGENLRQEAKKKLTN